MNRRIDVFPAVFSAIDACLQLTIESSRGFNRGIVLWASAVWDRGRSIEALLAHGMDETRGAWMKLQITDAFQRHLPMIDFRVVWFEQPTARIDILGPAL